MLKLMRYRINYQPRGELIHKEFTPQGTIRIYAEPRNEVTNLKVRIWAMSQRMERLEKRLSELSEDK